LVNTHRRDRESFIDEYATLAAPAQVERSRRPSRRRDLKLARIFELTGDLAGLRVLDLGCSIGMMAAACAERGALSVVGVDYTPRMVEIATELARERALSNVSFRVGDVSERNFEPASFDLVVAADIVEHLYPDVLEAAVGEVFHALAPGGRLLIHTTPTFYQYVFTNAAIYAPLLPMALLPGRAQDRILDLYYRTALQWAHWLLKGKTYDRHVSERRHCNPLTAAGLRRTLENAGFVVTHCAAEEFETDLENRSYRVARKLFRACSHLKWNLFATAVKPAE